MSDTVKKQQVIAKPPRRQSAWFWVTTSLTVFGLIGLIGGAWFQQEYLRRIDRHTQIYLGRQEGQDALEAVQSLIASASSEVMITARLVNSIPIMDLLAKKHAEGCNIIIILDSEEDKSIKCREYLISKGIPANKVLISQPINMQIILIDQLYVVTGTMPYNSQATSYNSVMVIQSNPKLANQFKERIKHFLQAQT